MENDELFQQALGELEGETVDAPPPVIPEGEAVAGSEEQQQPEDKSWWQRGVDMWKSAGAGIAKAGIETKDFIFGEPAEENKSDFRKQFEKRSKELADESIANSLTMGVSQIVTGLIGAGKIMAPVKAAKWFKAGGKAAQAGFEVARGATAGAVVIDPHEERLSNLVKSFPDLQNPVTDFLAAKPDDSAAEGRFKNALESIGADFALLGAVKAIKLMRMGNQKAADQEIAKLANPQGEYKSYHDSAAKDRNAASQQDEFGLNIHQTEKEAPVERSSPSSDSNSNPATAEPTQTGPDGGGNPKSTGAEEEVTDRVISTSSKPRGPDGDVALPTQEQPPKVIESEGISNDDLASILKGQEDDIAAIRQHGSKEAAIEAGHKFNQGVSLPWQKLTGTEDTMSLIRQTTEVLKPRYNMAKGGDILSDSNVKQLADELGKNFNEDPAMILGQLAEVGEKAKEMVPFMEAGMRISNRMFQDADGLAARIRNGVLDEFDGNAAAANQALKKRIMAAVDVMASVESILSNSGRSLRRARSEFRNTAEDLAGLRNIPDDKLAVVMEKAGGDPAKLRMLANRTWSERVMDQATFHMTNGLLWMWPTHLVNMTTNAMMLVGRPTEKLFGSAALKLVTKDATKRAELSSLSRQAMREYTYMVSSIGDGLKSALEAFRRGDSILTPHNTEYFNPSATGLAPDALNWKPVNSVWDVVENAWTSATYRNVVGLPTRTIGGADEFFKLLRYRSVVQSRASVEAAEKGLNPQQTKQYIENAINKAIDPASGQALDPAAIREAQTTTFQQDLNYDTTVGGSLGRGIQNLRKSAPITALILPFVKTPVNVLRYGIKMTPGLNLAQKEYRQMLSGQMGAEAKAHAMGQMGIGSLFTAFVAHQVLNGQITGAGPKDQKLKQELMATGWRPYSFVSTDEGGKKNYLQFSRFDPVATSMGLVADVVEMYQKDPERDYSDVALAITIAMAKNLGDKTFLQNINSAVKAFDDPEKFAPKWFGRTAGSMIPGSSLLRGTNPDPYLRDARGFVDSIMTGLPGLSDKLPKRFTWMGEPIERPNAFTGSSKPDIVEAEHNRIILQTGKGIGSAASAFEGVDLRDISLKSGQNAYERFQELSGQIPKQKSLRQLLEKTIRSKDYQNLPDGDAGVTGTRLNELGKVVQKYRALAKKYLVQENPELQTHIKARQREALGAYTKNRSADNEGQGARAILDALSPQ